MSVGEPVDAVDLAAPALLGALLWDSRRVDDVARWLEPEDFRAPEYRAIYRTLLALRQRGEDVDLLSLPTVLTEGHHQQDYTFPRREPRAAIVVHRLLELTPATPAPEVQPGAHSEHASYATLVLTDSVRRQVLAAGTTLLQHAEEALAADRLASIGERVERLERGSQAVTHRLAGLAARLHTDLDAPGPPARRAPLRASATPAAAAALRAAAPGHLRGAAGKDAAGKDEQRGAEWALLGSCLVYADVRTTTAATLFPEDFSDVDVAATWRAMTDMQRRGQSIDYVLVAAEVERRGGGAAGDRPGLSAADLGQLAILHRSGAAPADWTVLELVVRGALERVTAATRHALQQAAADPALSAVHVVRRAHAALVHNGKTIRRLGAEAGALHPQKAIAPAPASSTGRPGADGVPGLRQPADRPDAGSSRLRP